MEPNDLKSTPPDDAALETWLRANAALPPLPDHGFSRQVLAALPPPTRRAARTRRLATLIGALAGIALAAYKIHSATADGFNLPSFTPEATATFTQLSDPKMFAAIVVTALSLLYAFWSEIRPRLSL